MARDEPLIRIRLPQELKARLNEAKDANRRSLNAEIRMRLEWSFEANFDGKASDQMLANEVENLRDELRGSIANLTKSLDSLKKRLSALEKSAPA